MDLRIFFSTFLLIFLAELGDKTQLAAMASAAGGKSMIAVFLGASSALVLSTLIAVLFGSVLMRYIPDYYIKLLAGILFLIFGILLIRDSASLKKKARISTVERVPVTAVHTPHHAAHPGIILRTILESAITFEENEIREILKKADAETDLNIKNSIKKIADEEKQHIVHLRKAFNAPENFENIEPGFSFSNELPADPAAGKNNTFPQNDSVIQDIREYEKQLAAFYRTLSGKMPSKKLKDLFTFLSEEETRHSESIHI